MEKSNVIDYLLYKMEHHNMPSVIMSGAMILESHVNGELLNATEMANHLAAKLENVPLLRSKFVEAPLGLAHMRRIEDSKFDIWDHVLIDSLPAPGGYDELTAYIETHCEDLKAPHLWHIIILQGLKDNRLAIITRFHHALADGMGAGKAMDPIYSLEPKELQTPTYPVKSFPKDPTLLDLYTFSLKDSVERLWDSSRFLVNNATGIGQFIGAQAKEKLFKTKNKVEEKPQVIRTSLNISKHSMTHTSSYKTLPIADIKTLAKYFDGTINDICLFLYTYALESYFESNSESIGIDLICGVPVSVREAGDVEGGNQLSVMYCNLHNSIKDPVKRLQSIIAETKSQKLALEEKTSVVSLDDVGSLVPPVTISALLYLASKFNLAERFPDKIHMMNALLTNVPGPRFPVYIGNGLMVENIAMPPILDVMALTTAVTSTYTNVTFGFHGDARVVKDKNSFVRGIEIGMEKLGKQAALDKTASIKSPAKVKASVSRSETATDKGIQ
ncbi:DUF1298 domain-containing protein [Pseudomaricurvus alcaniphilus]|uniref:wax ester/triacylglycerol synthase domain-containing protein n=1 Tax=Pseudomaricurvus alcaniphilus TaxID=1166482 RepID=UPI001408323E|nr:wax ester/triacylglycerol synthase domain-containing protein [Pseudomaricurvus alcaniphilus]NHN36540.1 DUF1298 domain-containing protein [Pseudomaricurvus alcaniphilus]